MILGVDYGLKNIGLATTDGEIASPAATIVVKNNKQAVQAISQVVQKWSIKMIVIGISEGKSKNVALGFGRKLKTVLRLPVEYIDETLSTKEVNSKRRADKKKVHSKAAAIILQRWLDNNK